MCNNRPIEESERYKRLGRYAAKVLQNKELEDIAKEEGINKEELLKELESIKNINPCLYKKIFG